MGHNEKIQSTTIMVITVRVSDTSIVSGAGVLSYTLELNVKLDFAFAPFETRTLNTGITITPEIPCIVCVGKSGKRPNAPHMVTFRTYRPTSSSFTIHLDVSNPTSRLLGHLTSLSIIIFAVPVLPVKLDLLRVEQRIDEQRSRGHSPVNILAITPDETCLHLEIVATRLIWKLFTRDKRHTTLVTFNASQYDAWKFNTSTVISCSNSNVYIDQITAVQRTGNIHISFVTTHENADLPTEIAFKLMLRKEDNNELKKVIFPRYPDPSLCTPSAYGLKIHCPRDFIIYPEHNIRIDISVSYSSNGRYLGLFAPESFENISCQVLAWEEREILSIMLSSYAPIHFSKGQILGEVYFLPSDTLKTRKVTYSMANNINYTVHIFEPKNNPCNALTLPKNGHQSDTVREPKKKKQKTHNHSRKTQPNQNKPQPKYVQLKEIVKRDSWIEVIPSGALFKLNELTPMLIHCVKRHSSTSYPRPKKIYHTISVDIPSQFELLFNKSNINYVSEGLMSRLRSQYRNRDLLPIQKIPIQDKFLPQHI